MNCSICGSDKLFEISIIDNHVLATEGYVSQTVLSFACENCGHIELYAPQDMIDKHKEKVRVEKEKDLKLTDIHQRINALTDDIIRLESIISDENQTVKSVNIARKRLNSLKNELLQLQHELSVLTKHRGGGSLLW